jgi:integrase
MLPRNVAGSWYVSRTRQGCHPTTVHCQPNASLASVEVLPADVAGGNPEPAELSRERCSHPRGTAHPHGLRHSLAFDMAERDVSLLIIQKQLGHGSLAATATYIDHLKPTAVVDAMRAREW